jgi:hypothetical protein
MSNKPRVKPLIGSRLRMNICAWAGAFNEQGKRLGTFPRCSHIYLLSPDGSLDSLGFGMHLPPASRSVYPRRLACAQTGESIHVTHMRRDGARSAGRATAIVTVDSAVFTLSQLMFATHVVYEGARPGGRAYRWRQMRSVKMSWIRSARAAAWRSAVFICLLPISGNVQNE